MRAQEAKANAARLAAAQAVEKAARAALHAAQRALDAAVEARQGCQSAGVCADCALLRMLGLDECDVDGQLCEECQEPFCGPCFDDRQVCERCDSHGRCLTCCRERHGDDGDESNSDDSIEECY